MKAKILDGARRVFGRYGYHGATTRIIAREVGIDVSTLYYHWGEKHDLYQAVMLDITEDLREELRSIGKALKGRPLSERMSVCIDMITDYLLDRPEISNLTLYRYFSKTRVEMDLGAATCELFTDVARSMDLQETDGTVSTRAVMRMLAMSTCIYSFISGEDHFRSRLQLGRKEYVDMVKETLKFVLIPAFAGLPHEASTARRDRPCASGG